MQKFSRFLACFLAFTLTYGQAQAQSPFIYGSGGRAKALTTNGITLKSGATLDNDGPENLVKNARAEDPTIPTSFKVYDDGAAAAPVNGTGGSPSVISAWARTTTSGELIQGNATWKLVKGSGDAQGEGWAYEFTVPANHAMAKSSFAALNFDYYMSTVSGPAIRVYVYDVTNSQLITPSFVTCGGGSTPVLTATTSLCHAQLGFVTTTGVSYRVLFHVADATATAVNVFADNFLVTTEGGPQVGAGQSGEVTQAVSVKGATSDPTLGTNVSEMAWAREGEYMNIRWNLFQSVAGTAGSGQYYFPIPTGFTIYQWNVAQNNSGGLGVVGQAQHWDGTNYFVGTVHTYSSTALYATVSNAATAPYNLSASIHSFANANFRLSFTARVRINEFIGGTAFGENKVEWACSTNGTWDADATAANTVYGNAGCPITGALTANHNKVVRFRTAKQADEVVEGFINYGGLGWITASGLWPYQSQNGTSYGVQGPYGTSAGTDFTMAFSRYTYSTGATYGSAGTPWSAAENSWVLVKHKAGVPVTFGLASSTVPGLVSTDTQTFAGIKNNASMPAFRADLNAVSKTYNSNAGYVDLTWSLSSALAFNQGSAFVAGSNGTFTVPAGAGGIYLISAGAYWNNTNVADGAVYTLRVFKNTSTQVVECGSIAQAIGRGQMNRCATILSLVAGDTLNARALSNVNHSVSNATISGDVDGTFFSAAKLY